MIIQKSWKVFFPFTVPKIPDSCESPYQSFWLPFVYFVARDQAAVLLEVIYPSLRCLQENVIRMKEDLFSRLSVLSLESWPKKGVCVRYLGEG